MGLGGSSTLGLGMYDLHIACWLSIVCPQQLVALSDMGGVLLSRRYLVDCGAIKPLCDLLSTPDVRIVTVALEGLENILKVGRRLLVLELGTTCFQCL